MKKFPVGTRVKSKNFVLGHTYRGSAGTVVVARRGSRHLADDVGVMFDDEINGHDCNLGPEYQGKCWWVDPNDLEIIEEPLPDIKVTFDELF